MLLDIFHFSICQIQCFGICQTRPIVATLEDIRLINYLHYILYDVDSAKTLGLESYLYDGVSLLCLFSLVPQNAVACLKVFILMNNLCDLPSDRFLLFAKIVTPWQLRPATTAAPPQRLQQQPTKQPIDK